MDESNLYQPAVAKILSSKLSKEWLAEQFEKLAATAQESNAGCCSFRVSWCNPRDLPPSQFSPMLTLAVRAGEGA